MADDLREHEIRAELHDAIGRGPTSQPDWEALEARLEPALHRQRRRRGALVAIGVVVAAVVVAAVVISQSGGERVRTGPVGPSSVPSGVIEPSTVTTAVSPDSLPETTRMSVVSTLPLAGYNPMVARSDGLWYVDAAAVSLIHVDLAGKVVGRVTWPYSYSHYNAYGGPVHVASGEGSIWVLFWATHTLLRIDPTTMKVTGRNNFGAQAGGFEVEDVAVGQGHVWVTGCCDRAPSQRLYRIDPATMNVDGQVAVPGAGESEAVVAGPQGVFVTGEQLLSVVQIDPGALRILREIPVPPTNGCVSFCAGAGPVALGSKVWVLAGWDTGDSSGTELDSIDPATGVVTQVMPLPVTVQQLAASGTELWGVAPPPSGRVVDLGGTEEQGAGSHTAVDIAVDGDRLWSLDGKHLVEWKLTPR